MIDLLIAKMHDARFMTMLLAAIAASATAYTLIMPLFAGEGLAKRMKAVASERERLRQRERDRLAKSEKVSLRQSPKQLVSKVVEDFNLTKWLAQEAARDKLIMAGYRGHAPYVTFLFARAVTPIALFLGAALYVFVITQLDKSLTVKLGICIAAAYLGLQAPMLFLKNAITKRQLSIRRAFPDALDLLLICIESGMSVEVAFRKVSTEIAGQSIALSEEFALTTAELSYLQDRKVAYENLARRTGLEGVKSVCLALMQSERYGTPLGQSLRVMAQENRDMRMTEAEKKAAALPPKLTVPMILFFLPCLFIVIRGQTYIKVQMMNYGNRRGLVSGQNFDKPARGKPERSLGAKGSEQKPCSRSLGQKPWSRSLAQPETGRSGTTRHPALLTNSFGILDHPAGACRRARVRATRWRVMTAVRG